MICVLPFCRKREIDYFLVSDTLLSCTNKMRVLDRNESFYLPISITLNLQNIDVQCVQNNNDDQIIKSRERNLIKWDNEKLSQFMYECSVNDLKSHLQSLENDLENNVDKCIAMFCNFVLNASSMMKKHNVNSNLFRHNKYNSNTYFDKECFEQKLTLRKCFRKYRRNKNNENNQSLSCL